MCFFNHFLPPAFPDLQAATQRLIAENDMVTAHKIFHVSHKRDFTGIPANRKYITIELINTIRREN
jgi:predicted ester cyclase